MHYALWPVISADHSMCLQGAAFDLPEASAEKMLEQAGELIQRKFTLDRPSTLPLQEERGSVCSFCAMTV